MVITSLEVFFHKLTSNEVVTHAPVCTAAPGRVPQAPPGGDLSGSTTTDEEGEVRGGHAGACWAARLSQAGRPGGRALVRAASSTVRVTGRVRAGAGPHTFHAPLLAHPQGPPGLDGSVVIVSRSLAAWGHKG